MNIFILIIVFLLAAIVGFLIVYTVESRQLTKQIRELNTEAKGMLKDIAEEGGPRQ